MPVKGVTYILGAGLTHAAACAVDTNATLLTRHITEELLSRVGGVVGLANFRKLYTAYYDTSAAFDVEQIIGLFETSGQDALRLEAQLLKALFRQILEEKLSPYVGGLNPDLLSALFDRHTLPQAEEAITGIISLNYDGFSERALEMVRHERVDLLVTSDRPQGGNPIPFVKLHGSLDWDRSVPVQSRVGATTSPDASFWIAPSAMKALDDYPFNVLLGRSREILQCDLIRVVGCGLSRNDFHLVRMLFEVSLIDRVDRVPIEIIGPPKLIARVRGDYPLLKIRPFEDMLDFCRYVYANRLGNTLPPGGALAEDHIKAVIESLDRDDANVADEWVRSEYERLARLGPDMAAAPFLKRYIDQKGA